MCEILATLKDYRRQNLRNLISDSGGPATLAQRLGYSNASFLVQMTGPNPNRDVSEGNAREYEVKLGLPNGELDKPVEIPAGSIAPRQRQRRRPSPGMPPAFSVEAATDIVRMVSQECDAEGVNLPMSKFADLVVMVFTDSAEHDNMARLDHVRQLVRLLK
ncbi:hypothetical protein [Polaromonas sp. C04]|uniref:hypothetical protein n=1 Tax=Polaromonas sp. C04 TaxID=1945857 RepID=UPI000985E869|nr:hypothetical protein [Polaromonas sp. C04]OOG56144.1 hypothetical protein B0E49_07330 [Polaromonas sp. C04]